MLSFLSEDWLPRLQETAIVSVSTRRGGRERTNRGGRALSQVGLNLRLALEVLVKLWCVRRRGNRLAIFTADGRRRTTITDMNANDVRLIFGTGERKKR